MSGIILRIMVGFSIALTISVMIVFLGVIMYLIGLDNIMFIMLSLVILGLFWLVGDDYINAKSEGKR